MTGLLSAISGQFSRSLIMGALFPAAIFVLAWTAVVAPLLPPDVAVPAPEVFGKEWGALQLTFATLVLAGLLYILGTPLIQLYEGYPWQDSLLGRWRTRVQRARLRVQARRARVLFELTDSPAAGERRLNTARSAARRALTQEFPERENLVLPTRLGNVLRAFERYPSTQYGIEAIDFWPRLQAVIPPDYLTAIGDARTSLVFLLNLSFLSAVLSAATALAGLVFLPPSPLLRVLLPAAGFALLSLWFYSRSLGLGRAWGELVKGAFDLYRWLLLDKLGFQQKPATRAAERELWSEITQQVIYGDAMVDLWTSEPRADYAEAEEKTPRTRARAEPEDLPLEVTRGVRASPWSRRVRVVVRVANADPARTARFVVVGDTLREGMEYGWDSARVDDRPVRVVGTNPYEFHLGDVAPGGAVVLTYHAMRIDRGDGG